MKFYLGICLMYLLGEFACNAKSLEKSELMKDIKELLHIESSKIEHHEGSLPERRELETRSVTEVTNIDVFKNGATSSYSVKDCSLHAHNVIRAAYGVPDLVWDNGLAATAQAHADAVAQAPSLFHSDGNYGENVGYKGISIKPTVYTPAFTIFNWWEEVHNPGYDYSNPGYTSGVGHFTQVVWKASEKLGCAVSTIVKNGNENTYLVCQYYPPGNYNNKFADNVLPLKGTEPSHPKDIALEGIADHCSACPNYGGYCSTYDFVYDTCLDTCVNKK